MSGLPFGQILVAVLIFLPPALIAKSSRVAGRRKVIWVLASLANIPLGATFAFLILVPFMQEMNDSNPDVALTFMVLLGPANLLITFWGWLIFLLLVITTKSVALVTRSSSDKSVT